jgi:hypothetical protein
MKSFQKGVLRRVIGQNVADGCRKLCNFELHILYTLYYFMVVINSKERGVRNAVQHEIRNV